ncbi:MAG: restriction endonuclease subunit S [Pseudomonas sp.]|uniref:restriction endonuclease subunit S n=1 Tax=Pseudomonas sp. TaxID=306 RepID=UPI002720E10F|nr:restriction endonuclease subunit S [Pseudomonas sp.]MDO9616307.1 restriction endonuclease subunit S [Pseudomonas sp.]MDP2447096.1 restriction endonuclease subunit S [Pseudomonas sp.]MDZ4334716.1 restriction endonuclease subunit S [Pseudomonas sp.]
MLPKDWKTLRLSDIAKISSGGTPSRDTPSYWNGDIPWVRTTEVQNCHIHPEDIQEHISQHGLENSSAKIVAANSILLAMIGQGKTRGQVALLRLNAATNQNCAAITLNKDQCPDFYFQQLLSKYQSIRDLSNSAGQSNLSGALVKSIEVIAPPLHEQTKIAKILSTWDKAITTTERLLANSQQQKQALTWQLLTGKNRFAGFSDTWGKQKLSEISTRIQEKTDGEAHPILTISSLSGFVTQEERYSRYMAGESVNNYILLSRGEFAYNKGNSKTYQYGCIFKLDTFDTGLVPHVYVCFKLNQGFDPEYYAQLFAADYLKDQLAGLVNTGVRNNGLLNIKPSAFLDTTVPVPPLAEQQKIAQVLSTADAEISNLQAQLAKLKLEKKALMQQLLTGQRRVRLDDELEEEPQIRRVG